MKLKGQSVLVAGGAGYLGIEICHRLVSEGATVIVADIDDKRSEEATSLIAGEYTSRRITSLPLDVNDQQSIKNAVQQTVERLGKLDILVNATFASAGKSLEAITAEEFDRAAHINLTGAFLLAREAATVMSSGSSIIMFSSMYGQVSPDPRLYEPPMLPNPIEYGVAKAGIIQMVRYLAVYWGDRGIRVNAVAPGPFPNTGIQRQEPEFVGRLAAKTALGRIGQSDEIAGAVAFLASDEASYITGETISVNGGWTAW